ncbi:MAG: SDR family oxidoreductase [Anaerolineaceae bacterium]|nr:SDR family oxidoreductase [Anaerolineaceae bacterium]
MDLELKERVALVTGASRGIGLATAHRLAEEGCRLGLIARGTDDLHKAEHDLTLNCGATVMAVPADATNPEEIETAVDSITKQLGPIEILVNNVGGNVGFGGSFEDVHDDQWQEVLELNLFSVIRMTRAILPGMRRLGHGSIVMVATDAAVQPERFVPHYAAAKAAVLSLAKSLSRQYGPEGIRVNTVSPGMVLTSQLRSYLGKIASAQNISLDEAARTLVRETRPWITAGRPGNPEEIANVIAFLVSPRAAYVNGSNYRIDSGEVLSIA